MKTIIAGSRDGFNSRDVLEAVNQFQAKHGPITEVVCGMARGVDLLGREWARARRIPVKEMPANWKPHGESGPTDRAAGHKRNSGMAAYGEALIAIWDGKTPGTKGMIDVAKKRGLIVFIHPAQSVSASSNT